MVVATPPLFGSTAVAVVDPCSQLLLDETLLQRLANELARGLYDLEDILKQYGIDALLFNTRVKDNVGFMTFYAEAHAIWNSSSNAKERTRAKAGVIYEQWMREANRLLHDPSNPLAPKVELAKHLAKLADLEPVREAEAGSGNGVSVTINLGHARIHPQTITIDKVLDAKAVEVTPVLPPQVTSPGVAPTASAPPLTTAHEHTASLAAFRPSQQQAGVVWPGSEK